MQEENKVVITGFKTLEAAKQFASWYEGQGEQDIDTWWECRLDEGEPIGEKPYTNSVIVSGNTVILDVNN